MSRAARNAVICAALLMLAAAPAFVGSFTTTLLNYIGIYSLVTLGLVLLMGIGGLTSFGQASFVGVAAYATAWLTTAQSVSPWLGLLFALSLTAAIATFLGAVTLRLSGHFLPLSTIAWGLAIFFTFGNIDALGRYNGITGIPPIFIGPISLAPSEAIFYLIWGFLAVAALLIANLLDSREGRAIRSLRGGAIMIESLGVNAFRTRLIVFVVAALLAAFSGWLYAHMSRYISPTPFDVRMGIEYLFMTVIGGSGYIFGAVVGSTLVTLLENKLQDVLPYFSTNGGQLEIVVFSILFIVVLQFARGGIVPMLRRFVPKPAPSPLSVNAERLLRRKMPQRGTPVLKVEGLVKRFGGLIAVNQVSFEINAGDIIGLIGPNGAGKTTVFNIITGVLASDEGKVTLLGQDITRFSQRHIAATGLARTFQHVKLRPNMSLIDNVLLGTYLRTRAGYLRGAMRLDRAEEAAARHEALAQLRRVGLGDNADDLTGNLPLGNQRILEVARALAADPVIVVLDEPAAGLRQLEKTALAELLRSLRDEGVTIMLVEHDMDFVMNIVDRIVVMEFGVKLAEGAPAAVRADARVQEAYLGGVT
jgi:ABC-type branched-subunit amino acid transport system ATPase component/ABC-type branched-subunit amino acid transport system permease subunit